MKSITTLLKGRSLNNQSTNANSHQFPKEAQSSQKVKADFSMSNKEPSISEEDQIYFELIYLLEQIEDPEACYFYDQLETIRDKFKIVEKEKITQYFDKLVIVVEQDENENISKLYGQIKKIYDLLKVYNPDSRMSYASAPRGKKEFQSIDNMKPSRDHSSSIGEISDDDPQLNDVNATYKSDKVLPKQESLLLD